MKINEYDFSGRKFSSWELENDYHAVYILENGQNAYVGVSSDVRDRARRHAVDQIKSQYKLKTMHVITDDDFEETPTKHYENILIKLMRADCRFEVLNDLNGQKVHYKRKNEFERKFDAFWPELVNRGLVKDKEFHSVLNRNNYKYSPYTGIDTEQRGALIKIVNALISEETHPHQSGFLERAVLVNGDAGTGKTVVATALFYHLKTDRQFTDKKIALVIPNPSMRHEIQQVFKTVKGLYKKDVLSPSDITREQYDIIICDEAHKLRNIKNQFTYTKNFKDACARVGLDYTNCDELDWIMNQSESFVLFYDRKQSVSPSELNREYFDKRIHNRYRGYRPIELKQQWRVKAGRGYVPYIYNMLYQKTERKKNFKNYEFNLYNSFTEMRKAIIEKNNKLGLCRLSTGYPWKYISKKDENLFDIEIEGIPIKWNKKTAGWLSSEENELEMGSIYTLAGLDLHYAGVVIGPDLYFDQLDNKIKVNSENFFDNKVKKNVDGEELREYLLNTYAILLTRATEGTYVYVCDKALNTYLSKFITKC